ncbi:patatin-like phospholipase family protein [Corynebacterium bovis]|uniref:patatin-like phospholipase family protein n=1 Tax=Corynebacterium bovis TaxID=36808 RepID=UPI0021AB6357|nr:patatin family protein [Corynebacterium bovis]MDH2456294.1 patatin family protein [Corynebacterium bovis]MDK8511638.1 patatin family protein [Corynebacterium bovis]MDN8578918.1 patatin family protein [Corynebacterium bovis]
MSPQKQSARRADRTPPAPNVQDTALVFEGGAMRAAFSSAMVEALLESGVYFDWVFGNSASTVHVANYLAGDAQGARDYFTVFPGDPLFGGIRPFLRGDGFFNSRYIYGEYGGDSYALHLDWQAVQANPAKYRFSGFNGRTGETVHWGREHIDSLPEFLLHARASSSLPFIMPPTHIDGDTWFDGAFGPTGGIPLDAAEAEGFERFVVVMTRTRGYRKRGSRFTRPFARRFAHYPELVESMATRHIRYNATRDRIFQMEREGRAYVFAPQTMPIGNGTRKLNRLVETYDSGLEQARQEMPRIRRFLGLDG